MSTVGNTEEVEVVKSSVMKPEKIKKLKGGKP